MKTEKIHDAVLKDQHLRRELFPRIENLGLAEEILAVRDCFLSPFFCSLFPKLAIILLLDSGVSFEDDRGRVLLAICPGYFVGNFALANSLSA